MLSESWMEIYMLVGSFIVGLALGYFYFGGLWWTVNRLQRTRQPALLFTASFILRTTIVVGAVYLLLGGGWRAVALCMAGFIAIRMVLTRYWGPEAEQSENGAS